MCTFSVEDLEVFDRLFLRPLPSFAGEEEEPAVYLSSFLEEKLAWSQIALEMGMAFMCKKILGIICVLHLQM